MSIVHFSELSLDQRVNCAAIGDFLERDIALFDDREVDARILVALDGNVPVGWIRFRPRRFYTFSDGGNSSKMRASATIDFPVTVRYQPHIWNTLFDATLGSLFTMGIGWSATPVPEGAHGPIRFLEGIGYQRLGDTRSPNQVRGTTVAMHVYIRKCTAARGFIRPNLTPEYTRVPLMFTAAAATAPRPERDAWDAQLIYSGYSGYPWITSVLRYLLEPGASLLSIPCATGDLFRFMPVSMIPKFRRGLGVDILERNTDFAKRRLEDPNVDLLNMALNVFFWIADNGTWSTAEAQEHFVNICGIAGRLMLPDESGDYFGQTLAIHREVIRGGAITDWFAATKALATLLTCSPTPSIVRPSGRTVSQLFDRCLDITDRYGREIFDFVAAGVAPRGHFDEEETRASGMHHIASRTEFINENMFDLALGERFDVVFVWEATLMTAAVGREIEFVETLLRHVKPGGSLILTGIRSETGNAGRELLTVGSALKEMGCRVRYGSILPKPARWAIPFVGTPRFPYMVATPHKEI